jgi:hypothetical protein
MQQRHSKVASGFIVSIGVGAIILLAALANAAHGEPLGARKCAIHCDSDTDLAKEIAVYLADKPARTTSTPTGNVSVRSETS